MSMSSHTAEAAFGTPHVQLRAVTKRLGGHPAVVDVSLDVMMGTFVTLLGPSGCGKTTTLRIVAGFYAPDVGDVLIRGRVVNDVPPHLRNTVMVFQDYALFPHMAVADNVGYGLRMHGVPRPEARRRITQVLDLVGLAGQGEKFPHELSGGQQQRVALARALVVDPEVLLLDEPLSNLDAKLRVRVRSEIRQLQERLRKTILYVTHDQEEALAISDRIAVMDKGRIFQIGTPEDIYIRPANRFVADFVGLANFLRGQVVDPHHVRVNGTVVAVAQPIAQTGLVTLVIRPEMVRLTTEMGAGGDNVLQGRITTTAFLGEITRYWVRTTAETQADTRQWIVDVPASGEQKLQGEVRLIVPQDRIHVLSGE